MTPGALFLLFFVVGAIVVFLLRLGYPSPKPPGALEIDKELEKIEKAAREWGREERAEAIAKARAAVKKAFEKK